MGEVQENIISLISDSPEATERIGQILGSLLRPGDIVLLDGDLGAGKTVLTRGIAQGLGLDPRITSPTYTLVFEHLAEEAGTDLFHFDVYRLRGADDFLSSGLDEYFDRGGVCVIEWGERIVEAIPIEPIRVQLKGTGPEREISFCFPVSQKARRNRLGDLLLNVDGVRL